MPSPPVVDASPLIILAKAGYLELLRLAGAGVVTPLAVAHEVRRAGPDDPAARALGTASWLSVVDPGPPDPRLRAFPLDLGEESVLTWALAHEGSEALIDDGAARRCARALGIPHRGCRGLVLEAKRQGVIAEARPVVERLLTVGLRLNERVMNQALGSVGESNAWPS